MATSESFPADSMFRNQIKNKINGVEYSWRIIYFGAFFYAVQVEGNRTLLTSLIHSLIFIRMKLLRISTFNRISSNLHSYLSNIPHLILTTLFCMFLIIIFQHFDNDRYVYFLYFEITCLISVFDFFLAIPVC